jgi:nucleoside-diphosphate-sugar epimerase
MLNSEKFSKKCAKISPVMPNISNSLIQVDALARPRCLLTGAEGNLGKAIQRTDVFDLTCCTKNSWPKIQREDSSHYDLIIHAAGGLQLRPGGQPTAFVDSNVRALTELLEWIGPMRKPRVFFISSCAVYGNSISTEESSATHPLSVNGIAKLMSEKLLQAYCDEHALDFVSLRVFNIFGGNDRFSVLYRLRQAVESNNSFVLYNQGRAYRDFVHVDDVAQVIANLAMVEELPRYLNLGTGVSTRIADIVENFNAHFSSLKIEHRDCPEAEYSRANINLLQQYTSHEFQSVMDFIPGIAANVKKY